MGWAQLIAAAGDAAAVPVSWGQILNAALGASPPMGILLWVVNEMRKEKAEMARAHREERDELRAELAAAQAARDGMNDKMLALAERSLPSLTESARALLEVKAALDKRPGNDPPELRHQLDRLQTAIDDLSGRGGGGR